MSRSVDDSVADRMVAAQRRIVDGKAKVLVVFEGLSGRVIGRVANEFMNLLEPRGMTYTHFPQSGVTSPFGVLGYMSNEPASGTIAVYDRSWYSPMAEAIDRGEDVSPMCDNAMAFERYLARNGVVLFKVFLHLSEDRLQEWGEVYGRKGDGPDSFLTDDHISLKKYERMEMKRVIGETDAPHAPWRIIRVGCPEDTVKELCEAFIQRVDEGMAARYDFRYIPPEVHPNPRDDVDLTLEAKGYKKELARLSERLNQLQRRLAVSDRSLILVFEGWDAAGKGGTIRRVTSALNPRGYRAVPVAAPVGDEKSHTYLWRFARNMPEDGHIVIFDRSWYGRMMVEPIEGFCTEEEYRNAANEINFFESTISSTGGIVMKFWMEVSPEEQLRRFEARRDNPLKSWKITDEDWRNRGKWDVYEEYIDRMIETTNTLACPWIVVESEDKKYGRLKVLSSIVERLERELS